MKNTDVREPWALEDVLPVIESKCGVKTAGVLEKRAQILLRTIPTAAKPAPNKSNVPGSGMLASPFTSIEMLPPARVSKGGGLP